MKIKKKSWEGEGSWLGGGGVRVDVIKELKFLGKFKKNRGGGGGRGWFGGGGESVWGGGGSGLGGGVRVDVNKELKLL